MSQFGFGSGSLWGINTAANSTPVEFGGLQDVTLDFSFSLKELRGQYQAPIAIARGGMKITGKAKFANISARAFNDLFFGQTAATGKVAVAKDELGTVATAAITVANAATFNTDLGVMYSNTGVALVRVASAPAVGQYTVTAGGVYGFNATENAVAMKIDYSYNVPGSGFKTTLSNPLLGAGPTFKMVLWETYLSKIVTVELNACVAGKLALATKLEDFIIPELDFEAMADAGNNIGTITVEEP